MLRMHTPHHIDSVGPTVVVVHSIFVHSISYFGIISCLMRRFNKIRKFGTTEAENRFVWCADLINVLSQKLLSINCECEKHLAMAATNIIRYYFALALSLFSSSSPIHFRILIILKGSLHPGIFLIFPLPYLFVIRFLISYFASLFYQLEIFAANSRNGKTKRYCNWKRWVVIEANECELK